MDTLTIRSSSPNIWEQVKTAPPGSLYLQCEDASHDLLSAIVTCLTDFGASVQKLDLSLYFPQDPVYHDMVFFDFVASCPNLEQLTLKYCEVGASLLLHPKLKSLHLENCRLRTDDLVEIGVASTSVLEEMALYDTNWCNNDEKNVKKLTIGSRSSLKTLNYSLDEDSVETYPDDIEINGCPLLENIRIDIDATWRVTLKGNLPKLVTHRFSSGRFGNHELDFSQIGDGSASDLIRIRDGEGSLKGTVYVFLGENGHFQLDKAKHIVQVYGGSWKDSIDEQVTHAVLLGQASDEWDSEDLMDEDLLKLRDVLDEGNDIELIMENEAVEHFEDWY
ncbi:hypothetical protein QNI19_08350 [Cytophagaceae bacterium DM2B3-1]|uniref:Uncharacterized protein n=1 Tax=Xanthocytophaga flava TaxID=3048013 RepID=A0ABT7CJT3_9BACT|nr:hypothetical protein [Xanthocytophaga flavus]MDJ1471076.1 hypothetical protein [Xanthocytophaga flavus]MDJ1492939.1 hypothetical protein [Xanthocytophaga flavus]